MNFDIPEDIPIESNLNEEETERPTSDFVKQWPYMDITETKIPISRPKCKFYFLFVFLVRKRKKRREVRFFYL